MLAPWEGNILHVIVCNLNIRRERSFTLRVIVVLIKTEIYIIQAGLS